METLSESIQLAMHRSTVPPRPGIPLARDIMVSEGLHTFRAEQPVAEAIRMMVTHHISGGPVVEAGNRLIGMLSEHDCLQVVAANSYDGSPVGNRTVGQLMTPLVTAVDPDMNLFDLAHLFMNKRLRRVPVVKDGIVRGQVSRRDILKAIQI